MAVLKLWATKKPNLDFSDIGVKDNQLYFDSDTKTFYIGIAKNVFETVSVGLQAADESSLGGIKVGLGLSIDPDGTLNVVGDSGFSGSYNDLIDKPDLSVYQLTATAFTGDYNDLSNKPSIPSDVSDLTDNSNLLGGNYTLPTASSTVLGGIKIGTGLSIDGQGVVSVTSPGTTDYNNLINKPDLSVYQLAANAFSGNYTDLTNKPTIPSNVSQLNNDAGFITANQVPQTFGFSVSADDSTLRVIQAGESIKFVGGTGIETTSDVEGNITFNVTAVPGESTAPIKTFNILNEFSAPLLGKAIFVPVGNDTIRSVLLTNGNYVSNDLMVGLYRNNELLSFFILPAGNLFYKYTDLNFTINANDYLTVNVVAGQGSNFTLGLYNFVF